MGSQVVRDDRRLYDQIRRELVKMRRMAVTVGIHADAATRSGGGIDNVTLGAIHEFGTSNVPERSFLRSTVDQDPTILEFAQAQADAVVHGQMTADQAGERIGVVTADRVKRRIRSGIAPALAPQTIERKLAKGAHGGGLQSLASNAAVPLIDGGQLINSIDYKVQR